MRSSGILMHITSLPGKYGVGSMGKEAYAFVDFLKKAGQSKWQILPLTPTGYGDSPYQSCSTFAGNPYLIDLPTLVKEGLLTQEETRPISAFSTTINSPSCARLTTGSPAARTSTASAPRTAAGWRTSPCSWL